jgi:hypothetical protein
MTLKGGGFTGNQLFELFSSQYSNADVSKIKSIQVEPLDKTNKDLFNDKFWVLVHIDNDNDADTDNIRFIVMHKGTEKTFYDWGNNLRNVVFGNTTKKTLKNRLFETKRQLIADKGHTALVSYLINLYNKKDNYKKTPIKKNIILAIDKLLKVNDNQIKKISVEDAVEQLLKTRMSVLGHSQGAVYAYLFGDEGFETIVYNPATFSGTKPSNTYMIRRSGDPFSFFSKPNYRTTKYYKLHKFKNVGLNKEGLLKLHSERTLKGVPNVFGNPYLFTHDNQVHNFSKQNSKTLKKIKGTKTKKASKVKKNRTNKNV